MHNAAIHYTKESTIKPSVHAFHYLLTWLLESETKAIDINRLPAISVALMCVFQIVRVQPVSVGLRVSINIYRKRVSSYMFYCVYHKKNRINDYACICIIKMQPTTVAANSFIA